MTSNSSKKRAREPDDFGVETGSPTAARGAEDGSSTTNFRNVSACNRCRSVSGVACNTAHHNANKGAQRKNRCDQKLPRCSGCEKANVKCVGFDPVSKRAIPRSYVYYLETRVRNLESLLTAHNIHFEPPADDFSISDAIKP